MPTLYPVAGCRIYIGGAAVSDQDDDFDAADFSGVSWTEIKGWTQMGAIGDSSQLITADLINVSRTKKAKGTRNAGSMQNVFTVVPTDAGQLALIAAEQTDDNYPIKIELNDAAGGSPSMRMFIALVMGQPEQGGGANTAQLMNTTLEINSNIVRVAAS